MAATEGSQRAAPETNNPVTHTRIAIRWMCLMDIIVPFQRDARVPSNCRDWPYTRGTGCSYPYCTMTLTLRSTCHTTPGIPTRCCSMSARSRAAKPIASWKAAAPALRRCYLENLCALEPKVPFKVAKALTSRDAYDRAYDLSFQKWVSIRKAICSSRVPKLAGPFARLAFPTECRASASTGRKRIRGCPTVTPTKGRPCGCGGRKLLDDFCVHPGMLGRVGDTARRGRPNRAVASGQWRAMRDGNAGIHGNPGILDSISCRFQGT